MDEIAPSSQEQQSSPGRTEDEVDNPLVKHTLAYLKDFAGYLFDERHFIKYLKGRLLVSESKALKQLRSFADLYFPGTALTKSIKSSKAKFSPYRKGSMRVQTQSHVTDNVAAEVSIPSTPPTKQLKRGGSFMDLDVSEITMPVIPPGTPVNINVSIFSSIGAPPKPAADESRDGYGYAYGAPGSIRVAVVLPDDYKTEVFMPSGSSVVDLRRELRKIMITRYPAKRPDDIPPEKFHLKTKGGWDVNLADMLTNVIHEGTVIHCIFE